MMGNFLQLADLHFIKFISPESWESLGAQLQYTQANKKNTDLSTSWSRSINY